MNNRILFGLHLFVGVGALFGGSMAILNPVSPLGITMDALKQSPFQDYLIPGLILFIVVGLGNLFAALMVRRKSKAQGYISSVFSWAVVIWIVVQCIMMQAVAFLHVLFFLIGLVQAGFAARVLFVNRQFPANIALDILDKLRGSRRETGA